MKRIIDLLFPKQCISCNKEGTFLCEDCLSLIDVNHFQYCLCEKLEKTNKCNNCRNRSLDIIFSATSFKNKIVQKAIHKFKHSCIKELSIPLAYLIIKHLQTIDCKITNEFILTPVPLSNKETRARGFNHSKEITKILSEATKIPLIDCVIKQERGFKIIANIKNKKILLVDDVYTTGLIMEEIAKKLKESGASTVWGITVAREIVDL